MTAAGSDEGRSYQVLDALGKGGFGTVYKAQLLSSGGFRKPVALKVLNADMEGIDDIVKRLRDEANMLGQLRHRAIVHVDGLVRLDGRWSVVMEYVEGASFNQVIEHCKRVPPTVALAACAEVAAALDVAFARPAADGKPLGLLHRDIKPANVQLTSAGEVKLLDFGVARADFGGREAVTKSVIFGSVPYMAPERFELDDRHQSDVYALAATLFELIVGEQLGQASPNPKKHEERISGGIDRLRAVCPDETLLQLLRDGLAYEPDARPDARQFERRLLELKERLQGPWLKDWAETVVPEILQTRVLQKDSLSGSVLVESSAQTRVDGALPASPPLPPPEAVARPPRKRSTLRSVLIGGLLIVLLAVVGAGATALLGAGGFAYLVSFFWADAMRDSHRQDLGHMIALVDATTYDDPNREPLRKLLEQGYGDVDRIGFWEMLELSTAVKNAVSDGKIDTWELTRVRETYQQIVAQ